MYIDKIKQQMCFILRDAAEDSQTKNTPFMRYEHYFQFAKRMASASFYKNPPKIKNDKEEIAALPLLHPDDLHCEIHVKNWVAISQYLNFQYVDN